MTDVPADHLVAAIHVETGEAVLLWVGAGAIANAHGDLFGTSAQRIIRSGKEVIARDRLEAAIAVGWRVLPKAWPDVAPGEFAGAEACDPDFAWIERTEAERTLRDIV